MIPRIDSNELLEGVAQREEAAVRYLYRHYRPALYALALQIASWGRSAGGESGGVEGSSESTRLEKAVEDVFVAAWEAAPGFDRAKAEPDTWLVTLGHRLQVRKERDLRRRTGQHAPGTRPQLPPADPVLLQATRPGSEVNRRLAGLDDDSRLLLEAAFLGGVSVEELAELWNRSQREITQGLIRAVDSLRGRGSSDADASGPSRHRGVPNAGLPNAEIAPGPADGFADSVGAIDDAALLDYAFGTVGGERTAQIEAFLDENQSVANHVRLFQDTLAGLVSALEYPRSAVGGPIEAAEEDLIARLRHHRRPPLPLRTPAGGYGRRSQAWVGLGMAAALGLTVWLALGPLNRADRIQRRVERYQEQPGALSAQLHDRDGNEIGTLVRLRTGRLFVAFEERPADTATYQLWELRGERIRSLGTTDDRSILTPPVAAGALVSITLEPSGGSPEPSDEPLVELRL